MNHAAVAALMSKHKRDLLVSHVDGSAEIPVALWGDDRGALRTSTALIAAGLLSPVPAMPRPRFTRITEDGRMVLALILAEYAEALVRAGAEVAVGAPTAWPRLRAKEPYAGAPGSAAPAGL